MVQCCTTSSGHGKWSFEVMEKSWKFFREKCGNPANLKPGFHPNAITCKRQPIGMLGWSSGNHDWLLANASACVSCGFHLRSARNASDCIWMETGLNPYYHVFGHEYELARYGLTRVWLNRQPTEWICSQRLDIEWLWAVDADTRGTTTRKNTVLVGYLQTFNTLFIYCIVL